MLQERRACAAPHSNCFPPLACLHRCRFQRDVRSLSSWQNKTRRPFARTLTGKGPCAVDVAVVHPLAPSIPCHTVKSGAEAIVAMEGVKHAKYDECCCQRKLSAAFIAFCMAWRRRWLDNDDPPRFPPLHAAAANNAEARGGKNAVAGTIGSRRTRTSNRTRSGRRGPPLR